LPSGSGKKILLIICHAFQTICVIVPSSSLNGKALPKTIERVGIAVF
jgi:hypothetical protein